MEEDLCDDPGLAAGELGQEVRRVERYHLARNIYVRAVAAIAARFMTTPGQKNLEEIRDLAHMAADVWLDDAEQHQEVTLSAEPAASDPPSLPEPEQMYHRKFDGSGDGPYYAAVRSPIPGKTYWVWRGDWQEAVYNG